MHITFSAPAEYLGQALLAHLIGLMLSVVVSNSLLEFLLSVVLPCIFEGLANGSVLLLEGLMFSFLEGLKL